MPKANLKKLIAIEEAQLQEINATVDNYIGHRLNQLQKFQEEISALKKERLHSQDWHEKNDLTLKIQEKESHNPASFLPEFKHINSPYFASFSIDDSAVRIGHQQFLLGKQNLFQENKVVIIDWRQSAISTLYYEYEEGEEYDEEINGTDRSGILTEKKRFTIQDRTLLRIENSEGIIEKKNGRWEEKYSSQRDSPSARKESMSDHHLSDIVSLISPSQFRLITQEYHGCLRLQGSAGAGKTTIALHRLSYLLFNYKEKFRPDRCMVLMFNRILRDYAAVAVADMIGPDTKVDTFHSWATRCLRALGQKKITFSAEIPSRFDPIKKSAGMVGLIEEYAASAVDAVATAHLFNLYSSEKLLKKYLSESFPEKHLQDFCSYYRKQKTLNGNGNTTIGFADAGILLRLFQLRLQQKDKQSHNLALNYFDHLIIDEAQDFSQIELECLLNATTKERSLTLCADPNQQILQQVDTEGLTNFQLNLQKIGINSEELVISYRSTKEIMDIANRVLGVEKSEQARPGEPVLCKQFPDRDSAILKLEERVLEDQNISPNGLIAIICKHKSEIDTLYQKLRHISGVRKEPRRFEPGIFITNAHQVKGLEFTSVILWNPTDRNYSQALHDRNLLYVALTRACDRLALLCYGPPTKYIGHLFR